MNVFLVASIRDHSPSESTTRAAVYGATADDPSRHFLGWLGEVDPDELFDSGRAWGLTVVRKAR